MFTGIIDHFGTLKEVKELPHSRVLKFTSQFVSFQQGESIAVDGVCLTVTGFDRETFSVDVSPETLRLTHLGDLKPGALVNFERALKVGDRLGGHLVTGHVDAMGTLKRREEIGEYQKYVFTGVLENFRKYLFKKGSIAVNGVSLTLNEVDRKSGDFEVMLIPHTLQKTNLSALKSGEKVNLEFDTTSKMLLERMEELLPELLHSVKNGE